MNPPTRILIVEDLPTDAELNEREVRRVLPDTEFRCVETCEDFLAALETFQPELILSDYKLPRFDGMAALQLALELAPDTPFIIITGSMNEETAVECMKAGAWDYVIKEHIKRLGPAVIYSLEQKQRRLKIKQADAELREKYAELERFNKVTVGRELRMIELKQEVNALLLATGQPEKYRIVHDR
ncbi:MAG: response regulator [Verrucomicrobiota bacterium]